MPTQDIIFCDVFQIAGEAEDAEYSYKQRKAHREISSLQAGKRESVHICSSRDLHLRHMAS